MKITKMSLVAALLIGSSAFAIENTKISGDAKVYYNTNDAKPQGALNSSIPKGNNTGKGSLFGAENSAADMAVNLNATTDLIKNDMVSVSAGAGLTVLSTLGLENTFVNNVWGGSHTATTGTNSDWNGKVENATWINEAWMAITAGKTTAKLGRMELDTPLAFTEKWSIEKNTFEAAVVINQDIPDTTLVGAFVGNGNGTETFGQNNLNTSSAAAVGHTVGAVVNENGNFGTFGSDGAYALGVINNSWKPLTAQAWYYDVSRVATAYWLQADLNIEGILAGAQYSGLDINKNVWTGGTQPLVAGGTNVTSDVYALMLGYEMKDVFTAKVAYSQVGKDHDAGANTATNSGDSKLYTQAWWSRGYVTKADTKSFKVSVCSPVNGIVDLGLHYTNADQASKLNATLVEQRNNDLQEITLTVGKTFGPLDATLVYSNIDAKNQNLDTDALGATIAGSGSAYNQIQAYLTLNF